LRYKITKRFYLLVDPLSCGALKAIIEDDWKDVGLGKLTEANGSNEVFFR